MVAEGGHVWEIDVFLDRTLFLAEIELTSAEEVVAVPAWLAPYVVREVTTESGLVNARLAK
jgi:CYTH domain-containing protein